MTTEPLQARGKPEGEFVPPDPAELGGLLSGYEVEELIACGGTGAVYRAHHVALRREVAIKVLRPELSQIEDFRESFKSEARAMTQLSHPNLVGVYEFGEVGGMLYLVMEFVKGDSLLHAAHGQVIEAVQAVEIVAGVAAGLDHAHQAGVLHRDIKPANILITEALVPKLGDFGLAVATEEVASGMGMGTPAYMAPEVLLDFQAATPASDVFSLGMILHELLTGVTPTGDEPANLARIPPLSHLSDLVRKAIVPSPAMRYADGGTMAADLESWLEENAQELPHFLTASEAAAGVPAVVEQVHVAPPPQVVRSATKTGGGGLTVAIVLAALVLGAGILIVTTGGWEMSAPTPDKPAKPVASAKPAVDPVKPAIDPVKPAIDPAVGAPVAVAPTEVSPPESVFDLEAHQGAMRDALRSARAVLLEQRGTNAQALKEKAGTSAAWNKYFTMVDHARGGLPRILTEADQVVVDETMAALLNEFAIQEQRKFDRAHLDVVKKLRRESETVIRTAGAVGEDGFPSTWEAWVEWLGESPIEVLAFDLVGSWELASGPPEELGTTVVLDRGGIVTIIRRGAKGAGTLTNSGTGEWTIATGEGDRSWSVRWRSEWLKGENNAGTPVRFRRGTYRFRAGR